MSKPTAQEIQDLRDQAKINQAYDKSLYTPEMTNPPQPEKKPVKKAKGGYVKAADGIAQRGKTRGTMIMCKGGYAK